MSEGRRLVLHVGAMKSGTSHLQGLLFTNQELLAGRGVLVPGDVWRDQVDAVAEALGWSGKRVERRRGVWPSMVQQVRDHDGTAVISMEYLARIPVPKIQEFVAHFPDLRVEAVLTARDLGRNVPAMWQERVKNGSRTSFDDYVRAVRDRSEGEGQAFWREQNVLAATRRWAEVLGEDAVTVVTVPAPGAPRHLLWERFATAVGVDQHGLEDPPEGNESLGAASVELLRRLNGLMAALGEHNASAVLKHRLARRILGPHRGAEPSIGFEVPDWLDETSRRTVRRLPRLGVRVVGDPDELHALSSPGTDPSQVSAEDQLEAATVGLQGLVLKVAELRDQLEEERARARDGSEPG